MRASEGRVLYTATHDQDTLVGWWEGLDSRARAPIHAALASRGVRLGTSPARALIALAQSAPAPLVMMQAQDVLELGSPARMNTPGTAAGNWSWRLQPGALGAGEARWLRELTERAGRLA